MRKIVLGCLVVMSGAACGSGSSSSAGSGGNRGQGGSAGAAESGGTTGASGGNAGVGVTPTGGTGAFNPDAAASTGGVGVTPTGGAAGASLPADIVVNNVSNVIGIAVDSQFVYYVNGSDVNVNKAAKDGTGLPSIMYASTRVPSGIAVDASGVYWTEDGTDTTDGAVRTCPLSGCPTTPTTLAAHEPTPSTIALDDTAVYWANGLRKIQRVTKDGLGGNVVYSPATSVVPNFYAPGHMAIDATTVYFTSSGLPPTAPGGTWSCPIAGCGTAMATNLGAAASSVVLDATHLYAIGGGTGVRQSLKDGTGLVAIDATDDGADLATDGTNVYWTSGLTIFKCAVSGCTSPTTIATTGSQVRTIALDADHVYWAEYGVPYPPAPGSIRRAAK
jgi:hypothetical protein